MEKPIDIIGELPIERGLNEKIENNVEEKLDNFVSAVKQKKCQAFFAVAITDDGNKIAYDALHNSETRSYSLVGVIEIAKQAFLREMLDYEQNRE